MKKLLLITISLILAISLSACGKSIYPPLTENAVAFEAGTFIDESDDDAMYCSIEYNGRVYLPFGTLKSTLHSGDIASCIGYVVQDDDSDDEVRVFTLAGDENCDFLMEYYVGTNLMNQPSFYRAFDTKDEELTMPKYIDDLGYSFWR